MTIELIASVVVRDRDAILLVQEGGGSLAGRWNLPGGRVEPGEGVQAAARREVAAATGLKVSLDYLLGVYSDVRLPDRHAVEFVFTARGVPERAAPGPRTPALRWVALDALGAEPDEILVAPARLRRILADVRGGFRYPLALLVEPE